MDSMAIFLAYLAVGLMVITLGPAMANALVSLRKEGVRHIEGFLWTFVIGGSQLMIASVYYFYRTLTPDFKYHDLVFYITVTLILVLVFEIILIITSFCSLR